MSGNKVVGILISLPLLPTSLATILQVVIWMFLHFVFHSYLCMSRICLGSSPSSIHVWPWASNSTSLCLSFHIHKMMSTWWDCWDDYKNMWKILRQCLAIVSKMFVINISGFLSCGDKDTTDKSKCKESLWEKNMIGKACVTDKWEQQDIFQEFKTI